MPSKLNLIWVTIISKIWCMSSGYLFSVQFFPRSKDPMKYLFWEIHKTYIRVNHRSRLKWYQLFTAATFHNLYSLTGKFIRQARSYKYLRHEIHFGRCKRRWKICFIHDEIFLNSIAYGSLVPAKEREASGSLNVPLYSLSCDTFYGEKKKTSVRRKTKI